MSVSCVNVIVGCFLRRLVTILVSGSVEVRIDVVKCGDISWRICQRRCGVWHKPWCLRKRWLCGR